MANILMHGEEVIDINEESYEALLDFKEVELCVKNGWLGFDLISNYNLPKP